MVSWERWEFEFELLEFLVDPCVKTLSGTVVCDDVGVVIILFFFCFFFFSWYQLGGFTETSTHFCCFSDHLLSSYDMFFLTDSEL